MCADALQNELCFIVEQEVGQCQKDVFHWKEPKGHSNRRSHVQSNSNISLKHSHTFSGTVSRATPSGYIIIQLIPHRVQWSSWLCSRAEACFSFILSLKEFHNSLYPVGGFKIFCKAFYNCSTPSSTNSFDTFHLHILLPCDVLTKKS